MTARHTLAFTSILALTARCAVTASSPSYFAGEVAGSDAVVAVVREGAHLTAYACGGPGSYATLTRWFEGDATAGSPVELRRNGMTLRLDASWADGDVITGTLTDTTGRTLAFRASSQPGDALSGLYENAESGCRAGAVVWYPEGATEPSLQGTWCSREGLVEQVTPVRPMTPEESGLRVQLGARGGYRQIRMRAVPLRVAFVR
jgi:hypothetical protein